MLLCILSNKNIHLKLVIFVPLNIYISLVLCPNVLAHSFNDLLRISYILDIVSLKYIMVNEKNRVLSLNIKISKNYNSEQQCFLLI